MIAMSRPTLPLKFLVLLDLLVSPAIAERRVEAPEKMETALLWSVGWRQAAEQEMVCQGWTRSDADHFLSMRYGDRERAIAGVLGEKAAPVIILTLPSCKHFIGAGARYKKSLQVLEERLSLRSR